MPDLGDRGRIEPGVPEGTNAGLVSPAGTPIYPEMGTGRGPGLVSDTGSSGLVSNTGSSGLINRGKARVADRLHDLGDRIEHTGRSLESGNVVARPVGRVLDSAGNSIEGGANYLRTHNIGVIGDDFVDNIRQHPLVSAGVAIGVGWMLGQMFGGGEEEEPRRTARQEERAEEEHEEERHDQGNSLLDRMKGRVAELVAGGVASFAARKIRDRIAGD